MPLIPFRDLPDAGLARRLAAAFYDSLLVLAIWFVLGFVVAIVESAVMSQPLDAAGPIRPLVPPAIAPFVTLPVLWLTAAGFFVWFWRHGGQTLGMKTWRLRLVDTEGRTPPPGRLWLRAAVGTLSLLCLGLGFFWILVAGRSWHDIASRTRVVVLPKDA